MKLRITNYKSRISERGSVILYAMLTMSTMLAIGLTLNSLFLNKFRAANEQRNSVVAIYAADSIVEMCLYEARMGLNDVPLVMDNGAMVSIEGLGGQGDVTDDCSALGSSSFDFRAVGSYRGVRRALEINQ